MKTFIHVAEASERLEIDFTTLKQWTSYLGMEWKIDESGHEGVTESQLNTLFSIKSQVQQGKNIEELIVISEGTPEKTTMIDANLYENKLNKVIDKVSDLEQRISQKADEVVSYQLLKHRSELVEMFEKLSRLEQRITKMENKVAPQEQVQATGEQEHELPLAAGGEPKKKRKTLMQLFN